jgi:thymidylate kinase
MIIYIEGVDGSGKSTFAKAITTYLQDQKFKVYPKAEKLMVTHPWRLDRISKVNLATKIRQCAESDTIYIVDRGELSDIIYRTFDSDKYSALMTLKEYYELYKMHEHQHMIVHCDSVRSEQLMLLRGEDNLISIREHQKLRYLFNQIMPLFNARKFDAAVSIENPTYLDLICADIRMQLLIAEATDQVNLFEVTDND